MLNNSNLLIWGSPAVPFGLVSFSTPAFLRWHSRDVKFLVLRNIQLITEITS